MPLLVNQNSEIKTRLHENSVIDLTQIFYPGKPERQVLESNRESKDSNHERKNGKSKENKKTLENESISKHFIGEPLQYIRPKTQALQNSIRGKSLLKTEQQGLKQK